MNLDPTTGSEIKKKRPAVIVSHDAIGVLPLKIVVPITGWQEAFAKAPWLIPIERDPANGIVKKSAADTFQVRSISEERFVERLGALPEERMVAISVGLALSLDL